MWILFDCRSWTVVIFGVVIVAVVIFVTAFADVSTASAFAETLDFAPFLCLRPSARDLFFFGGMIRLVVAVAVAVAVAVVLVYVMKSSYNLSI